ncbi:MAG: copper amine oxidase N-terminal domain-containing protein [Oscillospiraceae bacterium]|nr:copper amine oxidase N-terminal domain-containing protein [Oscillospiraceae bacterium]
MKKRILAITLAVSMLLCTTSALAEAGGTGLTREAPVETAYGTLSGVIIGVNPYYDADENVVDGIYFVNVETNGDPFTFYISEDSVALYGVPEVGKNIIGCYNLDGIMPMIYPPQHMISYYAVGLEDIEYVIGGEAIEALHPTIYGSFILVPARAMCEALGYEVEWNADDNAAEIGEDVRFYLDGDAYFKNGDEMSLGVKPVIINDRAFVPLSFFRDVLELNNAYLFEGQIVIDNEDHFGDIPNPCDDSCIYHSENGACHCHGHCETDGCECHGSH